MNLADVRRANDRADRQDGTPPRLDRRLVTALLAVVAPSLFAAGLWVSTHIHVDAMLHTVALFVHLSSLVVGFGAVLVLDYHSILFLLRRCSLREVSTNAERLHMLVWLGLAGLVLSGFLLKPDLTSPVTLIKLAMVLVLTINGLQLRILSERMSLATTRALTPWELAWGAATALVSQVCWWGATFIGFWNVQH